MEKLEKNERKLKKQLRIYMKKVQELEGNSNVSAAVHICSEHILMLSLSLLQLRRLLLQPAGPNLN